MKNKFLLLVAALVLSTTTTFATNQSLSSIIDTGSPSNGAKTDMVTLVRMYMDSHDICCIYIGQEQGTSNYLVKDSYGIWYRVYTDGVSINGHSEIDF